MTESCRAIKEVKSDSHARTLGVVGLPVGEDLWVVVWPENVHVRPMHEIVRQNAPIAWASTKRLGQP